MEEPAGVGRLAWPVTQGVPFPPGELDRGAPVRLVSAEGEPLPAQGTSLATWSEDLRFVKWLLVDFQIDLSGGEKREVFLEYGAGIQPVLPEQAVKVEEVERQIVVDTGKMQVEFRRGDADFLVACRVRKGGGWKNLLGRRPGLYLYMVDQRGLAYDSFRADSAPTIAIEDSGPLRASVCIRGHHVSEDGRCFCPYVLRIHFYAGKADMRFYHTFVFDQDPERTELSAVGVRFPVNLGDGMRMAFGGETRAHWAQGFTRGQFLQTSDVEYRVFRDGGPLGCGKRTRGWGSLTGDEGSVVVVVRDAWQEYPKGIGAGQGEIDVEVWPSASGKTLRFSTPYKEEAVRFGGTRNEQEFRRLVEEKPTAPLNLKSLNATTREDLLWVEEMVEKYAVGRPASYNDTGFDNGFGAAKTTEFLVRFSPQPISDEEAENLGLCVQEPVIAPAETNYSCSTGAMRVIAPLDARRFPEVEAGLERLFEVIVEEPRRVLRTYGMIDYGDLMCSHSASPAAMWSHFKDDPHVVDKMKHCARSYNNEANDQLYALWGFFTHRGQRKHFLAAEAFGEHMADVDIIHAQRDGASGGLIHYHNAHHWTGPPSPSHTCIAGLMLQYYLTGNRRILEVCREVADWVLGNQEPCGIFRHREGVGVREYTTPLANLLEFYQATWEHEYGDLARRSLKWLLLALPEAGNFPESIYTGGKRGDEAEVEQDGWHLRQFGGMTPQLLYDAVRLFGDHDPIFLDNLVGMANRYVLGPEKGKYEVLLVGPKQVERQDPYFNCALIAYAYELTENPYYAAYCRYYLREHFPRKAKEFSFTYVCWGSIIPPMMEAVRRAEAEYGTEALDGLEQEWLQRVEEVTREEAEKPIAPGRPPRHSLGVIKGYAF